MTTVLPVRPGAADQLPRGRHAAPAATPSAARRLLAHAGSWLVRLVVGFAVVTFLGLAVGPHVFGYRTMTMLTGSMAPRINPGDVVVSTPLPVNDITTGMVISYHIPIDDHRVVSHRVIAVDHAADGRVTVQTKGDANNAADPWKATLSGSTVYQVRLVVPELGRAIEALRTPVVRDALVYGAPAALAGWLLLSIWRPRPAQDENGRDQDEQVEEETP